MRLNPALLLTLIAAGNEPPPPPRQPRDLDEEARLLAPLDLDGRDVAARTIAVYARLRDVRAYVNTHEVGEDILRRRAELSDELERLSALVREERRQVRDQAAASAPPIAPTPPPRSYLDTLLDELRPATPIPPHLAKPCPRCRAGAGERCRGDGLRGKQTHRGRK